jgi:hypothetical protein
MKVVLSFLMMAMIAFSAFGQDPEPKITVEEAPTVEKTPVIEITNETIGENKVENNAEEHKEELNLLEETPVEVNSQMKDKNKLRDPFKRPTFKLASRSKTAKSTDDFSNIPTIGNTPLNSIKIVGVLLGKNRRAIAKIVTGAGTTAEETYILKEGMKLGDEGAELKAILPGGIVIVEKIRNVYDQDEYLETVIPVTTE